MTKIINLKTIILSLSILIAVTAVVFYVVPQLMDDTPVAEACCGGEGGNGNDYNDYCNANPGMCGSTPTPKPPKCDFLTASPETLPYGGGSVNLSWGTTKATSVSISGIGSVSADGSTSVNVNSDRTFTLTATNADGSDTCTAHVEVEEPSMASCDLFTISPSNLPYGGGNVTLTWETTNATSVSINNGVGSVAADGSTVTSVSGTTTFTLTANGTNGSDNCTTHVTVEPPVHTPDPRCDYFTISDNDVEEGDEITLKWGTTNADEVYISNGVGYVSHDGEKDIRVYDDESWTLTVKKGNKEDTCHVSVDVDEDDDDNDPRPKCELTISDSKVNRGDKITLEWETSHADDIEIEDDNGKTIFDTDDYSSSKRKKYYDGEIDVIINRDTEFTLTARGDGGKRECDVDVEVEDDVTVYEKRDQPYVISLTQVPYTGFEAGPTLTFIFYALITLWALFVSYVLVIKRGSILGFSLYGAGATSAIREDEEYKKKVNQLVAKYAHRPWN